MGIRFRKSIKIAPGVRMNIGKKGASVSVGGKGFRYSVHSSGRTTKSVGIPGSGVYYTSTSNGRTYQTKSYNDRERLRQQKLHDAQWEVDMYENDIERMHSIHLEADEPIDWVSLANEEIPNSKGKNELEAIRKRDEYKPTLWDRLFKKIEKKKIELQRAVSQARKVDEEEIRERKNRRNIAKLVLEGDEDIYLKVIEEMEPFGDLTEWGSGFEVFYNNKETVEVEFDVNSEMVIPKEEKTLTKTGRLSVKALTKTKYYDLLQDYVCSTVIRVARDIYSLLPVSTVYVHAYENVLNTATGHEERICILSVHFTKETVESLNYEAIDCSDAISNFPHKMKFLKTKGFQEVEPIVSE